MEWNGTIGENQDNNNNNIITITHKHEMNARKASKRKLHVR